MLRPNFLILHSWTLGINQIDRQAAARPVYNVLVTYIVFKKTPRTTFIFTRIYNDNTGNYCSLTHTGPCDFITPIMKTVNHKSTVKRAGRRRPWGLVAGRPVMGAHRRTQAHTAPAFWGGDCYFGVKIKFKWLTRVWLGLPNHFINNPLTVDRWDQAAHWGITRLYNPPLSDIEESLDSIIRRWFRRNSNARLRRLGRCLS